MEGAESRARVVATCVVVVALGVALISLYIRGGGAADLRRWSRRKKKRAMRVYMDGCFDMMHYDHCNALRQAHALGDEFVVGVVSEAEIIANKGPSVTPLHERMIMVKEVKWVDDVIPNSAFYYL